MSHEKTAWTRNRTLAVVAVVLGAVAIFGSPGGGARVTLDTRELAAIVESEVDHVTVQELSDWIIQGHTDFRLIDLRDEESYAEYHIPLAERVPLGELHDYPILRNEKIVLYSDGGIHSAQAWFLLRAQKFPGTYILLGGLDFWKDEILFPVLEVDAAPEEVAAFERARFVSEFFGGTPQTGVDPAADGPAMSLPTVKMPTQPVVRSGKRRKKKKGC
jgi:rhodanese-related sulfurtransferase